MALALLIVIGLKVHYSQASPSALRWILAPTTQLVEWATGETFAFENGVGYVSETRRFAVAAPCAGVNFLIVAFATLFFGFFHTRKSARLGRRWLVRSLGGAFLATVLVNAARILVALFLLDHQVTAGWLTQARVHRLEGIFVYLLALSVLYVAVAAWLERSECALA